MWAPSGSAEDRANRTTRLRKPAQQPLDRSYRGYEYLQVSVKIHSIRRLSEAERIRLGTSRAAASSATMRPLAFFAYLLSGMRCLHPCVYILGRRFAGVSALLCLVFLLMPCAAWAVRHQQRDASSRPGAARIVHASARSRRRREHHVRPHTARALRRVCKHGTQVVRAAARAETQRVARGEDTDASESASLNLPEEPLARRGSPAPARQP